LCALLGDSLLPIRQTAIIQNRFQSKELSHYF
jgi:hypothetical protein